jgi:transposase-like protein
METAMPAGRPPMKSSLVDNLPAPEPDKQRLRVILQTLSGELSIAQACEQLDVSETRFHDLRRQALEGALGALAPKSAGRPVSKEPEPQEVHTLREQVKDLEFELQTARVKTELAIAMPHVLREKQVKKKRPARMRAKPRIR